MNMISLLPMSMFYPPNYLGKNALETVTPNINRQHHSSGIVVNVLQ